MAYKQEWRNKKRIEKKNEVVIKHLDEMAKKNMTANASPAPAPHYGSIVKRIHPVVSSLVQQNSAQMKNSLYWKVIYNNHDQFDNTKGTIETTYNAEEFEACLKVKNGNQFFDWLIIKKSTIPNAGLGLFAAVTMPKHCVVGQYMGQTFRSNKINTSEYGIRCATCVVDAMGGVNSGHPWFWGVHFVNDPLYVRRGLRRKPKKKETYNVNAYVASNLIMYCSCKIMKGKELLIDYDYH